MRSNISFLSLNCDVSKSGYSFYCIIYHIKKFDIAVLSETWCEEKDKHIFENELGSHSCAILNAIKTTRHGSASENIALYEKRWLLSYVDHMFNFLHGIVVRLEKPQIRFR